MSPQAKVSREDIENEKLNECLSQAITIWFRFFCDIFYFLLICWVLSIMSLGFKKLLSRVEILIYIELLLSSTMNVMKWHL